ncbi:hypothetical protein KC19_VG086700 [Ceratodon purpureus]|uniref:Uncharacterized protein n=1 Tax=Ceratodon purpureus TaxID=3225 RepID=A0A8T0HNG4_CERPU|nr:hypothetical protein KC19_VG086700 [Ceratodon purpureus]
MDPGWQTKVVFGKDIVRCTISLPSVTFRYHVGRLVLYSNFKYRRERLAQDGVTSEQIDQVREEDMVVLPCFFQGLSVARFEVGRGWPLSHIRREVAITLGDVAPEEFRFVLKQVGYPDVKVNRRHEGSNTVSQVLPPWTFEIVALTS